METSDVVSTPIKAGSVALARAMTRALRAMEEAPAEVAGAVSEHVASARLGVSLDVLRRDRRTGKLGIPFIKIGEGKRGLVRYDLADLDLWVETKKRRATPPAKQPEVEQPIPSPEPWVEEPPPPRRPSPPRIPWEALAETVLAETEEEEPFPGARVGPRRAPGGYFSG